MPWAVEQRPIEMKAAVCFAFLCRYGFTMERTEALRWWEGLTSSPHARCRWFVRKLLNYRGGLEGMAAWVHRTIPPKCLVETLDILVQEHRLSQPMASRMQDRVLALLTSQGWK